MKVLQYKSRLIISTILVFCGICSNYSGAQDLPKNKPITIMVGLAAGGGVDLTARTVAEQLQKNLGQTVVVENRPGAGGNIAQDVVVAAPPDGSVILLGNLGMVSNPHLMSMTYDPLRELAPITMGVRFPNVLVVGTDLGVKTLGEYIQLSKRKKLDFASGGVGSAAHLTGELLNERAGIDNVHIPYKGGSAAILDVLAGRVALYYATPSTALPYIESKKLIALATTGLERSESMPGVPTVAESGFPDFDAMNWYAFVASSKTPPAILERLNSEIVKVLKMPEVKEKLAHQGLAAMPGTRDDLGKFMKQQYDLWGSIIKSRRITMQ
jgi:tripartite-type tricarboxylate transporter receptor subunit TctC